MTTNILNINFVNLDGQSISIQDALHFPNTVKHRVTYAKTGSGMKVLDKSKSYTDMYKKSSKE
jgi:hypothetical protein